jgi:hypothetical protein
MVHILLLYVPYINGQIDLPLFWVNYNISLTWIKANIGMISLINHDPSEGEQWGRYNLPRLLYVSFMANIWVMNLPK